MHEKILIPTDGSDRVQAAVEYGVDLAAECEATVHALYVIETKAHYVFTAAGHNPAEMDEYREYGTRIVEGVVDQAVERGLDGIGAVRSGNVAQEITAYARERDVDCIVMGAQGRTDVDDYLVGGTTEKVVRTADVPVTTVRHRER